MANAGIASYGALLAVDPEAFRRVLDVNVLGVFHTVRAALPSIIERRKNTRNPLVRSVQHGATLTGVPTTRPRHSITETEPVQEALDTLRAALGDRRVDFAELVVLGAHEKTRQLQVSSPAARRARARLAKRIVTGETLVDVDAAAAVKQHGLIA